MIIVTGTSSGIGLEIAKYLVSKNISVLGISRRETSISSAHFKHYKGDATDPATAKYLSGLSEPIEGVVFNHGVIEPVAKLADAEVDEWKRGFDINVFSNVALTKALLPKLRASKAKVIYVSSGAAVGNYPTWGCYGATKAALNHFVATLGVEEPDLTAVSVAPGVVDTNMQENIRNIHSAVMGSVADKFHELHREGKLVKAEDSGRFLGNLVLNAETSLNGKFVRYGDANVKSYE